MELVKDKCPTGYFGSYKGAVELEIPKHMRVENGGFYHHKTHVLIDRCIVEEIMFLWSNGINTFGSCCGHGVIKATVVVDERDECLMRNLGYSNYYLTECGDKAFYLKSKHIIEE